MSVLFSESNSPLLTIVESDSEVNQGMPPMESEELKSLSRYEFWPTWFFYTPVIVQSIWYGIKYKNMALPLIVNPTIKLSGMVGESKNDILELAGIEAKQWISDFVTLTKSSESSNQQTHNALMAMSDEQISFPIVAKPDLGCRGAGVKLVKNEQQLESYISSFPNQARYLLQTKAPYEAEAGLFYVRYPGEKQGKIISITLKYSPFVTGDGQSTLKELIMNDPRAGQLNHLYLPRHEEVLDHVISCGSKFRLAFAGSHSRGAIFRDGNQYISPKLTARLDTIFDDLPGFHYGRLDVKFKDIDSLMDGHSFTILEINGASSEAAHIWDRKTPLKEIFNTLLFQYKTLYQIGKQQTQRGYSTPSFSELYKAWRQESQLVKKYPTTD
ncbi:D-alanine--D-alanine ligase [Aliivibrio kagoshimensis]|uniref:D-alanine--D-alanine ligase n=1 Tax=Aliivibrio kagoshimensis TaxID=2910230 RepID=UPI003D13C883